MCPRNETVVDEDAIRVFTKSGSFLVDPEDLDLISMYRWCMSDGYPFTNIPGRGVVRLHRFLMDPRSGELVDHKDGDKSNNRRDNLRITTKSGNAANRVTLSSTNRSGYHGVHHHTQNNKWIAQIKVAGKRHHIGCFDTAEEAARAYNKRALKEFGEFATQLNRVEE